MTRSRSPTRSRSSCQICEGSLKPVASLDSSIRSAARATYSAYKRQPIRWRLAGGSAALTLVILLGFAVIVGTLTTRAIYKDFNRQVSSAADRLQAQQWYTFKQLKNGNPQYGYPLGLNAFAASNNAAIRVVTAGGRYFAGSDHAPDFGPPKSETQDINGWRVETRELQIYIPDNLPDYYQRYDFRIY